MTEAVAIAAIAALVPTIATVLSHLRARARAREQAAREALERQVVTAKLDNVTDLVNGSRSELLEENKTLKLALSAILEEVRRTPHSGSLRDPAVR